jgi:hypothetical protein
MSALPNLRSDLVAGIARDRARRRRRRLLAGAAALPMAVAALAVLALLPSASSRSPAQALAQATRQVAHATAGHIVWTTTEVPRKPTDDGSTLGTNTMDVRYQSGDVAIDTQSAVRQADGAKRTVGQASTRIVDGVLYYGAQGAQPTRLATGTSAVKWLADQNKALSALAAAAQSAANVTTRTADGATTYAATIDADGLAIPGGPGAPVGYDVTTGKPVARNGSELTTTSFGLDGQASLEVTVTDGTVTAFTIAEADGHFTVHAELSNLGQPQNITAP